MQLEYSDFTKWLDQAWPEMVRQDDGIEWTAEPHRPQLPRFTLAPNIEHGGDLLTLVWKHTDGYLIEDFKQKAPQLWANQRFFYHADLYGPNQGHRSNLLQVVMGIAKPHSETVEILVTGETLAPHLVALYEAVEKRRYASRPVEYFTEELLRDVLRSM